MAITIKSREQIELMRESGRIVFEALAMLEKMVKPGITTKELDSAAEHFILKNGAKPSFKGYRGFPASICSSVNNEVIHGVPGLRRLKDGDIISIDIGVYKNGFHGDAARTFPVGNVSDEVLKFISVTKQSFFEGIKFAKAGHRLYEVSNAIADCVEKNGYSVVRDWVGHGIGRNLHEEPQIPHNRQNGKGPRLYPGMVLAIEPMVNMGTFEVRVLDDEQTVVTEDGKLSAHYENSVLITEGEPELLTLCG
ncbi:MAG: type I methionyl aminopeptidase [Clostridiales bacterium]|jgi:methionyl aminopeptidase|nr:type I methionyl aminopeptidase [Clostridiales bacterium]